MMQKISNEDYKREVEEAEVAAEEALERVKLMRRMKTAKSKRRRALWQLDKDFYKTLVIVGLAVFILILVASGSC